MTPSRLFTRSRARTAFQLLRRHGQTLISGGILAAAAVLFVLGCGGGKDGVITDPTTTGTPTTGTPTATTGLDFTNFPKRPLLVQRTSRGAVELSLSVAPTRPLSVILFQANVAPPELHFDVDARYTGFGLGGRSAGEFVPYLRMSVRVTNSTTNEAAETELVPVISLSEGLHYARNLRLPGLAPLYAVQLIVRGPEAFTASGGGSGAVVYQSDLTPSGISGTVVQPGFTSTYTANLVLQELTTPPTTTTTATTTTGPAPTPTTGPPPTTGGYGQ